MLTQPQASGSSACLPPLELRPSPSLSLSLSLSLASPSPAHPPTLPFPPPDGDDCTMSSWDYVRPLRSRAPLESLGACSC